MFRKGVNTGVFSHLRFHHNVVPFEKRFFSAAATNISSETKKLNGKLGDSEIDSLIKTFNSLLKDRKVEEENRQLKEQNLHKQINRKELYKEQMRLEDEQNQASIEEYKNTMKSLTNMEKATSTAAAKRTLVRWYGPVTDNLNKLLIDISTNEKMKKFDHLLSIPVEQLAVVALNTVFNGVLRSGNDGAMFAAVCRDIGDLLETENNLIKVKEHIKEHKEYRAKWQTEAVKDKVYANKREAQMLTKKLRKIHSDEDEWDNAIKLMTGAELVNLVLNSALKDNGEPAFFHHVVTIDSKKKVGMLKMDADEYDLMRSTQAAFPRHLPMLVPPKDWDNKSYTGAYLRLKVPLMKTTSKGQKDAVKLADMDDVLIGLNYLGQTAWRINDSMLDVIEEAQKRNIRITGIPDAHDLPEPDRSTCFNTPQHIHEKREAWKNDPRNAKQIDLMEATKEKRRIAEANMTESERAAKAAKLAARLAKPMKSFTPKTTWQELDLSSTEPVFDERMYAELLRRVKKKNSELHSLRCDLKIKLDIARQFRGQTIYYPHNLDFRGRAYPVPPNLSHLGNDLCRGLLIFNEKRPLGVDGYKWLKIHLCNLFGNNKISMDDRHAWTESHIAEIFDSAERPIEGNRWWMTFESPFQALACCKELKAAMESPDPTQFLSSLPVHQDGSCNGLQHYAGLGRDSQGAKAVNLIPSSTPQDVYTRVLEHVLVQIDLDAQLPDLPDDHFKKATLNHGKLARLVQGKINRKVIKQTVMTSVYGVTGTGARAQVQARLVDKYLETHPGMILTREMDTELFFAGHYVATLTLKSLGQMFGSANSIMEWLGECSMLVSEQDATMAWVTPLGLPVVQPYRRAGANNIIKTALQQITLTSERDHIRVSSQKQKSAFPPNFVHSMDATHMLMTCLKMKNEGKVFASVHDSYWTHACDINLMNELLRECFVHLYEYPVLDDLKDSLDFRFPGVEFPPIPQRGDLDIKVVKNSKYFFH